MRVHRTCQHCAGAFQALAAEVNRGKALFCSKACRDTHRRNRASMTCQGCGATFAIKPSDLKLGRGQFCSKPCYDAARGAGAWVNGTCDACRQPFLFRRSETRRFCSEACYRQAFSDGGAPQGQQHGNWRNGNSERQLSYGSSWRRARREARERDGRCMDCDITPVELGKALDVHHIEPFRTFGIERHREANALTNLVSLCRPCHRQRDRHRIGPGKRAHAYASER